MYNEILNTFESAYIPHLVSHEPSYMNLYPHFELMGYRPGKAEIHLHRKNENWAIVFVMEAYDSYEFVTRTDYFVYSNVPGDYLEKNNTNQISIFDKHIDSKLEELYQPEFFYKNGNEIPFPKDTKVYDTMGISKVTKLDGELHAQNVFLYLIETQPELFVIKDEDIQTYFREPLDKIMTISSFKYPDDVLDELVYPRKTELFTLLAKVVSENDSSLWKPAEKPNNHWSNWENPF